MDKPSIVVAVVVGLTAGVIATAEPTRATAADVPVVAPTVETPAAGAGCVRRAPDRNVAPAAVTPPRPPDMQLNSDGVNRAGGVGALPSQVRGDPCASISRPGQRERAIDAAPAGTRASDAAAAASRR
jgi:hypothetical protein